MSLNLAIDSNCGALDLRMGNFVDCVTDTKRVYAHINPYSFFSLQSQRIFKSVFNTIKNSHFEEDLIIGMIFELIDYTIEESSLNPDFLLDFYKRDRRLVFNLRTTIKESKIHDVEELFLLLDNNSVSEYLLSILYKYFSKDMTDIDYEIFMLINAYNTEMACNLNYDTNLLHIQIIIDSSEL